MHIVKINVYTWIYVLFCEIVVLVESLMVKMQQTPKPEAQLPAAVPLFSVHSVLVKHVPLRFVLKNLNIFYYFSTGKKLKFEPNPMTIYYTQKYEPST